MDTPVKLATLGTQDQDKQNHIIICVGHHSMHNKHKQRK
jgi:hypothetical protein